MKTRREQLLDEMLSSIKAMQSYNKAHARYNPFAQLERLLRYGSKYALYLGTAFGLFLHHEVQAKTFWGRRMILPLWDIGSFSLYLFGMLGGPEYKLTKFLVKHLKDEDVFYDVGANYGFYTYLAQELIFNGEVHAFEPLPNVFEYLGRNADSRKGVFLNNIALAAQSGTIPFFDASFGRHSAGSTMRESAVIAHGLAYQKIEVPALTLADYAKDHRAPTIMKIDTEGSEADVVSGGLSVLSKNHPLIIMEIWNGAQNAVYMKAVSELRNAGYRKARRINEEGDLEAITMDDFFAPPFHSLRYDNFVFLKGE